MREGDRNIEKEREAEGWMIIRHGERDRGKIVEWGRVE